MAFANGRLPTNILVQAANGAPGQLLEAQTAKQWAAMVAGAASDGVHLAPEPDGGVSSCYRSYDNQAHAKQVQDQGGPTAATPGTSNHGLGIAIDIVITSQTLAWLNAHAAEYGFDNAQGQATYPPENWHWVRTRVVDTITNTIDTVITRIEETMALPDLLHQVDVSNGKITNQAYIQVGLFSMQIINADYAAALLKAQGKGANVDNITVVNANDMVAVRAAINANVVALKSAVGK